MKSISSISLVYLLVALTWITGSDALVNYLSDSEVITLEFANRVHTFKGYFFVLATALMLDVLIRRHQTAQEQVKNDFIRLFEENPTPMWIYSLSDFRIIRANMAAAQSYGYVQNSFKGMSLFDLRPESEHGLLAENLHNTDQENPLSDSGIWLHQKANGQCFYVHIYSHKTIFEGQEARIVSAIDVDASYKAENERKQMIQRLQDYAYLTSHDIRGPLTRLMALTDYYNHTEGEDVDFVLQNIRKTSDELDAIIRKMNKKVDDELAI